MYKVYGRIQTRAARVIWLLEELGQSFEFVDVWPHDPQVAALNHTGKVPILVDGYHVLSDSSAIMTYLSDKYGALTYPVGSYERAIQNSVFHAILDELDAILWLATRHALVLPEEVRVPKIRESAMWEFDKNFRLLENRFQGPFLLGEQMTIADILLVHCMSWAEVVGFPLNSEVLTTYDKRMRERPAYRKLVALG